MYTTEELRSTWDEFATEFERWTEPMTQAIGFQMSTSMDLSSCTSLLEVGAGSGGTALLARPMLPEGCRHVVTDLSPKMMELARRKLPSVVEICPADAEHLPFPDASFDRYLANMNWMIVVDPDLAAREAFRVLQPKGIATWSIWGDPEDSPWMTLPKQASEKAGITLPDAGRSFFHLAPQARQKLEQAGFQRILEWTVHMVLPLVTGPEVARFMVETSPRTRALTAQLPPSAKKAYTEALSDLADEVLQSGRPIRLQVRIFRAEKLV